MAKPQLTGLMYVPAGVLAVLALADLWQAQYLAAGRGVLLALAMGVLAIADGRPGRVLSAVVLALILGSLGLSIYRWTS